MGLWRHRLRNEFQTQHYSMRGCVTKFILYILRGFVPSFNHTIMRGCVILSDKKIPNLHCTTYGYIIVPGKWLLVSTVKCYKFQVYNSTTTVMPGKHKQHHNQEVICQQPMSSIITKSRCIPATHELHHNQEYCRCIPATHEHHHNQE